MLDSILRALHFIFVRVLNVLTFDEWKRSLLLLTSWEKALSSTGRCMEKTLSTLILESLRQRENIHQSSQATQHKFYSKNFLDFLNVCCHRHLFQPPCYFVTCKLSLLMHLLKHDWVKALVVHLILGRTKGNQS